MTQEVDQLVRLLDELRAAIAKEREYVQALAGAVDSGKVEQIVTVARDVVRPLLELEEDKANQVTAAVAAAHAIGVEAEPPPTVKPAAMARQFRSVIDQLHQEARDAPGEVATTLRSVDIEVKALIVVADDDEAAIVTPTPVKAIDPGQLSTIRMSFASIPVVRPPDTGGVDR